MNVFEGSFNDVSDAKVAIVAARFNEFVVRELIAGAKDALLRHGLSEANLTLARVPGAWEIPPVCKRLALSGKFEAVIALGAVIRGGTPHFEYVCSGLTSGLAAVQAETGVPVSFGVLTTDSIEQAIERAGTKAGNKGVDAAMAALETISLNRALKAAQL
jgi:6,7-dimethyl-8-ribityllumazine synthase